ncbi:hypothetical protein Ddye_000068 [Dipteronia dyeriana]|uniref:Uncharacterized protein n=1 Tax=Dipteronia dyeriana TaxID=168575 RepID=A0AAE0CS86_9ROSI|nr:hypothetical protein Ddye_000068 [Dipteronia dyeriana]
MWANLLHSGGRKRSDASANGAVTDLEHGDAVPAANVGSSKVLALAKPDAGKLIIATVAFLFASVSIKSMDSSSNNDVIPSLGEEEEGNDIMEPIEANSRSNTPTESGQFLWTTIWTNL